MCGLQVDLTSQALPSKSSWVAMHRHICRYVETTQVLYSIARPGTLARVAEGVVEFSMPFKCSRRVNISMQLQVAHC